MSIVDEMARAACPDHYPGQKCVYAEAARAAAAVVAKRIRDELGGRVTDAGLWEYMEQLAAELEGGT